MPDIADEAQITADMNLKASLAAAFPVIENQLRDESGRVICVDCGEGIPVARLAAVPWACRCIECQRLAENPRC